MGFTRRFPEYPGDDVITAIEGIDIIDISPQGPSQGTGTGCTCQVGEFADMTYCTAVDGSGNVTTKVRPQEVFGLQDYLEKCGGFDETIGEFGKSGGNAFVALRSKKFTRLVIAPVNLASAKGMRFFRDLPLNTSATDTTPVVPVVGATLSASREFRNGSARVRVAQRNLFTQFSPIATGVGGATVNGASAVVQVFNATAGFDWTTIVRPDGALGARKGDILVVGYNTAGAKTPTSEAGTYRVQVTPTSGVAITVERLDGTAFVWTAQSTVSWRLHVSSDADTAPVVVLGATDPGGYSASEDGGYSVPVRPLTNFTGGVVDGSWTAGSQVTPAVVPPATTGSTWDPLSGLAGRVHVTGGLAFTALVQKSNAPAGALLDALYATAFDATISEQDPVASINQILTARTSQTIRLKQKSNQILASSRGVGRTTNVWPELDVVSVSTVIGSASPGVGATRAEGVNYTWPGITTFIPEAVGFRLKTADGLTTVDGRLDLPADSWLGSILSNLAPERNPGQSTSPVPEIMTTALNFQRACPNLGLDEYIVLKAAGICAFKMDKDEGPIFQSGVTSSIISGQKNINRRRMSYYIQDSLAALMKPYSKQPQSITNNDNAEAAANSFMLDLLSPDNNSKQRIDNFGVKQLKNPTQRAKGIMVLLVQCRLTPTADAIVIQTEIGENVLIVTDLTTVSNAS